MVKNPSLTLPISFSEFNLGDADISPTAVQKLNNVFEQQIQSGLHPGAQFVVLKHGQVIFDGAAGLANIRKNVPVTKETPFLIFSSTKAFTAICIHHLVEAGKLELDAPVAVYWPEFGCKGKQSATIRHTFVTPGGYSHPRNAFPIVDMGQPRLDGQVYRQPAR